MGTPVDGAGYGLRREIGGRCSRFLAVPAGFRRPGEYRTGSVPYPDYGAGPAQTQPVVVDYWVSTTITARRPKIRLRLVQMAGRI